MIVSVLLNLPVKARFAASEARLKAAVQAHPGFNRLILAMKRRVGELPQTVPRKARSFWIGACEAFPGGYLFYDAMPRLDDGAGFAYLPKGVPADASTGWFDPDFLHLQGDWYVFVSSW